MNDIRAHLARQDHLLLWFDLETTGLDEKTEEILEVGWGITGLDLEWIMDPKSYLIDANVRVQLSGTTKVVVGYEPVTGTFHHEVDDFVIDMHDKSGLWTALCLGEQKMLLAEAERTIMSVLDINPESKVTMAGSGVAQFDMRWIAHHMPALHGRLTYYQIDIGAYERVNTLLTQAEIRSSRGAAEHRAVSDIIYSHGWAQRQQQLIKIGR